MILGHNGRQSKYNVTVFIQSLAHLNSVANPIIYMLFNTTIVSTAWFATTALSFILIYFFAFLSLCGITRSCG